MALLKSQCACENFPQNRDKTKLPCKVFLHSFFLWKWVNTIYSHLKFHAPFVNFSCHCYCDKQFHQIINFQLLYLVGSRMKSNEGLSSILWQRTKLMYNCAYDFNVSSPIYKHNFVWFMSLIRFPWQHSSANNVYHNHLFFIQMISLTLHAYLSRFYF